MKRAVQHLKINHAQTDSKKNTRSQICFFYRFVSKRRVAKRCTHKSTVMVDANGHTSITSWLCASATRLIAFMCTGRTTISKTERSRPHCTYSRGRSFETSLFHSRRPGDLSRRSRNSNTSRRKRSSSLSPGNYYVNEEVARCGSRRGLTNVTSHEPRSGYGRVAPY